MTTVQDICRLCLQETDPYNSRKVDMRRLCVLWKFYKFDKMDASLYRNHIICDTCLSSFKALKLLFFNVKNSQNEILQECKKNKLSKINLKQLSKYRSVEGEFEVCRLCLKPTKNVALYLYDSPENILPVNYIRKMLQACKIHMNFTHTLNPVSCHICWENIQVGFAFWKQLEKINGKIETYSKILNKSVISREDLQKIVDLYNIEDPVKIKSELDQLFKKELCFKNSICKVEDIKPKIEPESPNSEKFVNPLKKIIRDGPIDDLHYKLITEANDIQNHFYENDKNNHESCYENDKIVLNPYHDIDKVVANPFSENNRNVSIPNAFYNIENQNVIHFDNLSHYSDDNFEVNVCENEDSDTIDITEQVERINVKDFEYSEITTIDKEPVPNNIYERINIRSDLQIKKEITVDEEEVYVKTEILSDDENDTNDFEDDIFIEDGGFSECQNRPNILGLCPTLDAVIKNEPSTHPEDTATYDIHYIEHFDQGPPLLEPEIPCVVKKPFQILDEKLVMINKICSLNSNNTHWSPTGPGSAVPPKRGRGRPPKKQDLPVRGRGRPPKTFLPVRNLAKEMSSVPNNNMPSKINPVSEKKVWKSNQDRVITRSLQKINPVKEALFQLPVRAYKKRELKNADVLGTKKMKTQSVEIETNIKKPRKVHIFKVNTRNAQKSKLKNKNDLVNHKEKQKSANLHPMQLKNLTKNKNMHKKVFSPNTDKKMINKKAHNYSNLKENLLKRIITRRTGNTPVLRKAVKEKKKLLKNPLNTINTRSSIKKERVSIINSTNTSHKKISKSSLTKKEETALPKTNNFKNKSHLSPSLLIKNKEKPKIKNKKTISSSYLLNRNKEKPKNEPQKTVTKNKHTQKNSLESKKLKVVKGKSKKKAGFDDENRKKNRTLVMNQCKNFDLSKQLIVNVPKLSDMVNDDVDEKKDLSFAKEKIDQKIGMPELDSVNENFVEGKPDVKEDVKPVVKEDVNIDTPLSNTRLRKQTYFAFHCEPCGFKTFNKRGAVAHQTRHKNNSLRTCPSCPYKSSLFESLKKHILKEHPGFDFRRHFQDLCFYCHKKCILQITCKHCQNIFHFRCISKTSSFCKHEEEFVVKTEVPDHNYSLPPEKEKSKKARSPSTNPPILHSVQISPSATSNEGLESQQSPPLLQRESNIPDIPSNDCKALFENLYTDLRVEKLANSPPKQLSATQKNCTKPSPPVQAVKPVMHAQPIVVYNPTQPQNNQLFAKVIKTEPNDRSSRPPIGLKKVLYPVRKPDISTVGRGRTSGTVGRGHTFTTVGQGQTSSTVSQGQTLTAKSKQKSSVSLNTIPTSFQMVQNIVAKRNIQPTCVNVDMESDILCIDEASKKIKQEVLDIFDMSMS